MRMDEEFNLRIFERKNALNEEKKRAALSGPQNIIS
jgi:hypothetical protein